MRTLRQVFRLALSALHLLGVATATSFKSRTALQLENLALRHQLAVLRRSVKRPKLRPADRLFWTALRSLEQLAIFLGHRQARDRHWLAPQGLSAVLDLESSSWPTRPSTGVQRNTPTDSEDELRESALGLPRIHGDLLKLGIDIGETRVGKYIVRRRKPPSQTWKTLLENVLEQSDGKFELTLINPQDVQALPGRKTDRKDGQRIAELLQYGLLKGSFLPPPPATAHALGMPPCDNGRKHPGITIRFETYREVSRSTI